MTQRSILIVETPRGPLQSVAATLRQNGCLVHLAEGMREALQQAMEWLPDVVVLSRGYTTDEMLDLCRSILRNLGDQASPAILIAPPGADAEPMADPAHDSRLAESLALDLLAQSVRTLTFRAKQTVDAQAPLHCHGVCLDPEQAVAEMDGERLDLTPTEFRLLQALLLRPGHVLTRAQLEEAAGLPSKDSDGDLESVGRTRRIDVHVKSIRGKLRQKGVLIETVRGIGYRFREAAWDVRRHD